MTGSNVTERTRVLSLVLLFSVVAIGAVVLIGGTAAGAGNTLVVDGNGSTAGHYATIQDAVDNSSSGDTIAVEEGVYDEAVDVSVNNVTITAVGARANTTVTYQGDGADGDPTIDVDAANVTVDGFTVERIAGNNRSQEANHAQGVIVRSADATISNNRLVGNLSLAASPNAYNRFDGVMVLDSDGTSVVDGVELAGNDVEGFDVGVVLTTLDQDAVVNATVTGVNASANRHGFVAKAHVAGGEFRVQGAGNDFTGNAEESIYLSDATESFQGYDVATVTGDNIALSGPIPVENGDSVQTAVDVAATGTDIQVGPGTYEESVTVNVTGLTVEGPNAGTDGASDARGPEATVTSGLSIAADNVTVDGLQVENADTNGIRFGPDTAPDNVTIQNSVVTNVTGAVGGKSAGNGIQFQFNGVANETVENIQVLDNEISNVSAPAANPETIAVGVNVLPRGNDVDIAVRGNTFTDIEPGDSATSRSEARGVSLDTQDDTTNGFGRADGAVVTNNTFSGIVARDVVRAVALFEDESLSPREGVENFSVTRNNFTGLSGADVNTTGAVFVGNYETLGAGHEVTENNFDSGGVLRLAENQTGFTPAAAEALDATENWWGSETGPSGAGFGVGNPVSANVTFDPWLDAPYPAGVAVSDNNTNQLGFGGDSEVIAGQKLAANSTIANEIQPVGPTSGSGRPVAVEHVLLTGTGEIVLNNRTVHILAGGQANVTFSSTVPERVANTTARHEIRVRDESQGTAVAVFNGNVSFTGQALGTNASGAPAVLVEDVETNADAVVAVTYENGTGDQVIAGLTQVANNSMTPEDVTVPIEDTGGFPGTHTAHVIRASELSGAYAPGDTVSATTAESILDSETATVFDASVTITDQQFEDSTTELTVDASDVQPAGASAYVVVVHNQTGVPAGGVGPPIGFSANQTGAQSNVTVPLTETLETTTDVLAMVHFPGDPAGTPIPMVNDTAFGIGDAQAGTVTGTATAEIQQAQNGNVDFQSQVLGTSNGSPAVLAENVQSVDVATVDDAFDPQDDFLVLTSGTGVTGPSDVLDFVQLSELDEGADVALNATGATPGQHTVVLHEPNATGTGPDPSAPRTDASTGEVVDATATVFAGAVRIDDQTFEDSTTTLEVNTSDLQPAGASEYVVVVHNQTGVPAGGVGPPIGFSANQTGAQSNVTVPLTETLETTTDLLAMIHFPGDPAGTPIPTVNDTAFGIGDAQAGTVTGTAMAEIVTGQVSITDSPDAVERGDNLSGQVSATITAQEVTGTSASIAATLVFEGIDGEPETALGSETVELGAGESGTVTFTGLAPIPGNATAVDSVPASLRVETSNDADTNTTSLTNPVQTAIDFADTNGIGTVDVRAGTYEESVTAGVTGLTLEGPNAGIDGASDARGPEATVTGGLSIAADDVTVDGLQVENAGRDGIRFGPDTVPDNVTVQHSVVTNVTGAVGAKSAGNGIQFQFDGVANETAENIRILDNEISNVSAPAANPETIAIGVNVLPRGNDVDLEIRGNTFTDIEPGVSANGRAEARAVSLDTQDDNTNGFGRVDGAVVTNNTFSDIAAPGVVRAIALFEDESLSPREGVENFSVTRNSFTSLSGADVNTTGAVFVGSYETLGAGHEVTENNFDSGGVLRFAVNQSGFAPAAADDLDATGNWWGNATGPSGAAEGTGIPVSENVAVAPWLDAPYPDGDLAPDVTDNGEPATDTTGDSLLDDVDGNEKFDIFDIQALFKSIGSPALQDVAGYFDFSDMDDGEVTVFDVQSLFRQLPTYIG